MREGSKSSDFDSSQLWVLAEWLVTPSAENVRDPLVQELSKMVDAWAAGTGQETQNDDYYPCEHSIFILV